MFVLGDLRNFKYAKARRPNAARLFSGFLVPKEGQQKIADLDNVVVRKTSSLKLSWIVRSYASSIRPKATGSIIT
jgi:hypothetical protein